MRPDERLEPHAMTDETTRKQELRAFLFLTAVLVPALSVIVVAAYGLGVWIYQMFAGPPTG